VTERPSEHDRQRQRDQQREHRYNKGEERQPHEGMVLRGLGGLGGRGGRGGSGGARGIARHGHAAARVAARAHTSAWSRFSMSRTANDPTNRTDATAVAPA